MATASAPRDRLIARPVVITNRRRGNGINLKGFCAGFVTSAVFCLSIFLFFIWYTGYFADRGPLTQAQPEVTVPITTTEATTTKGRFQEIDLRGFQGLSDLDNKKPEKSKEDDREDSRFLLRPSRHLSSKTPAKRVVAFIDLNQAGEPTDEQLSMLTHIIFYPFQIHQNGSISLKDDKQKFKFERFIRKAKQFNVKVMFSTVELMKEEMKMGQIISSEDKRKNLLNSIVDIIKSNNLDGVDIHWTWARTVKQQKYLNLLCDELYHSGQKYIISVSTGLISKDPKIEYVSQYVDFFNIETFHNYGLGFGGFDEGVGQLKPFSDQQLLVEQTLKYYKNMTKAPEKLNLVIEFHKSRLSFDEIESKQKMSNGGFSSKGFLKCLGKAWSTETAKRDLKDKLDYVKDQNIGGLTIWRMENDDGSMLKMVPNFIILMP